MAVLFFRDLTGEERRQLSVYLADAYGYDLDRLMASAPYLDATFADVDAVLRALPALRARASTAEDPRYRPLLGPGVRARRLDATRRLALSTLDEQDKHCVSAWLREHVPGCLAVLREENFRRFVQAFGGTIELDEHQCDLDALATACPGSATAIRCEAAPVFSYVSAGGRSAADGASGDGED